LKTYARASSKRPQRCPDCQCAVLKLAVNVMKTTADAIRLEGFSAPACWRRSESRSVEASYAVGDQRACPSSTLRAPCALALT